MDVPLRFVIPWRLAVRAMGRKIGLWSFLRPLPKPCLMPAGVRCVFREALRLYPPVPIMVRETTCSEAFRDRTLPKGSQVVLSPWHLHRHERLWDDPDAFDLERYHTENGKTCLRDAFIPFSAGARVCPGAGFAMIEGPLLIAAILRKYHVSMTEHGRPVPVAHLTVRAKDGIWLHFQSRD